MTTVTHSRQARLWLRALAVVFAVFTVGHTVGTMRPVTSEPREQIVISTMQAFEFPIMGFTRSYWDFYRGFSLFISVLLAMTAVISWQLGTVCERNPSSAEPLVATLLTASLGLMVLNLRYFFSVPIIVSMLAVVCAAAALWALKRELRSS